MSSQARSRLLVGATLLVAALTAASPAVAESNAPAKPDHSPATFASNPELALRLGAIAARDLLPNLRPYDGFADWDYPLVPRDDQDASWYVCHVSDTLPGNVEGTYWNAATINDGDADAPDGFELRTYADGDDFLGLAGWISAVPPGFPLASINKGPVAIRGGRHTLELRIDPLDEVEESDETDNNWAWQFIWTPLELELNVVTERPFLPRATGGWESAPPGAPLRYNCDGLRFTSTPWWNAVWVKGEYGKNVDCRLHYPSTGAEDGFSDYLAYSHRAYGLVDAVIVNRNTVGQGNWDVGALAADDDPFTECRVRWIGSDLYNADGAPRVETIAGLDPLHLHEFYYFASGDGVIVEFVVYDFRGQPIRVGWLPADYTVGALVDVGIQSANDIYGYGRLAFAVADPGYNCLVVYRDWEGHYHPTVDLAVFIHEVAQPDFLPWTPGGWHSPLVPRPAADGTPEVVAAPDTLHGNAAATWFNYALRNDSPTPFLPSNPYLRTYLEVDAEYLVWQGFHPVAALTTYGFNLSSPFNIKGGRHTVAMHIDQLEQIPEFDETNNVFGEQYCWSPQTILPGATHLRSAPPDRIAAWETIPPWVTEWWNCDGLRIPHPGAAWWSAMIVVPLEPDGDIDPRLHETLAGVTDGFQEELAWSWWLTGQSDYVLANYNETAKRAFDVGVLLYEEPGEYWAETAVSVLEASDPTGSYGPYAMDTNRLLHLHEYELSAGELDVRLENLTGSVDWGLTLHPTNFAYQYKGLSVPGGLVWGAGPGQDESISVTIPADGYYCLAVWKVGASDVPLSGSYNLVFSDVTDVPPDPQLPAVTKLVGCRPNPFNPRTTVAFDVAGEQQVTISVFDVTGLRVAVLCDRIYSAGFHALAWNGRDAQGRAMPSGTYIVRLETESNVEARKVMLLR